MRQAVIKGRPVTKGRPRLGRRRKAYTPARTIAYEQAVAEQWASEWGEFAPYTGPVGMRIVICSEGVEVEVWELEEGHRPKYVQGDVDNYVKAISDGLNGHAYKDDKQVHHVEVFFTKEPLEETNEA